MRRTVLVSRLAVIVVVQAVLSILLGTEPWGPF